MMRTHVPSRPRRNTGLDFAGVVLLVIVCIAISVLTYAGGIMALAFGWAMPFTKALLIAAGLVILSGLVARH